ncbi:MAG: hypothetical protein ABI678_17350 [Kofleriaceae bacterium]
MVRASLLCVLAACAADPTVQTHTIAFDLHSDLATGATYWDLPYPSDLRLAADGTVDLTGFPNRRNLPVVNDLLAGAKRRAGFPVMPIAYVKFTDAAPDHALAEITPDARILDIDDASPERGHTFPVVAQTLVQDDYTGKNLVALAPYPGIVLRASTRYAFVIDKAFAPGTEVPEQYAALAAGTSDDAAATALYKPLWPLLDHEALVATVFTTGDEVAVLQARSEAVRTAHHLTIDNLHVDPTDGAAHTGYCELVATVTFPQFQTGTQPFDHDGLFELDAAGAPIQHGEMTVPLTLTIPDGPMPANGWPPRRRRPFAHRGLRSARRRRPGRGRRAARDRGGRERDAAQPGAPAERLELRVPQLQQPLRVPVHVPAGRVRATHAARRARRAPDSRRDGVDLHRRRRDDPPLRRDEARRGWPLDGRDVHEHDRGGRAPVRCGHAVWRRWLLEPDDPRDRDRPRRARSALGDPRRR